MAVKSLLFAVSRLIRYYVAVPPSSLAWAHGLPSDAAGDESSTMIALRFE